LRYKPYFQASRSFIGDEISVSQVRYPLFLKGSEKEKLGAIRLYYDLRQVFFHFSSYFLAEVTFQIMNVRSISMPRKEKDEAETPISYEEILLCLQVFFEKELSFSSKSIM
jgi:hypothetical protein